MVLSWGVLEALRCLKALYSFWGNSLFKRCSTDTNSPQELLADMRNHKVRAAHLINHGELCDPQWKPRCWPLVPAEETLRTQAMFPSKQEQIQGSVYTFNLSFLLRFRKSLTVAGKLTVPVCPGLLLHAWQHSWLCWSLSQWLLLPLCPPTRGPSLKHQQWLLGRKKKNVHVSKENNSSHSLGWCHLECPVGCGSLTGLHPARVVGQSIAQLLDEGIHTRFYFSKQPASLQLLVRQGICLWAYCLLRLHFSVNCLFIPFGHFYIGLSFLLQIFLFSLWFLIWLMLFFFTMEIF